MYPGKEYPQEAAMFVGEDGYLLLPHTSGPILLPREKLGQVPEHRAPDGQGGMCPRAGTGLQDHGRTFRLGSRDVGARVFPAQTNQPRNGIAP